MTEVRKGGGIEKPCPRPCGDCKDGNHHFSDMMLGFADEEPEHEAAKAGCVVWLQCKHCDAWREDEDDLGEDEIDDMDDMDGLDDAIDDSKVGDDRDAENEAQRQHDEFHNKSET